MVYLRHIEIIHICAVDCIKPITLKKYNIQLFNLAPPECVTSPARWLCVIVPRMTIIVCYLVLACVHLFMILIV
jgi:hypothetical protein